MSGFRGRSTRQPQAQNCPSPGLQPVDKIHSYPTTVGCLSLDTSLPGPSLCLWDSNVRPSHCHHCLSCLSPLMRLWSLNSGSLLVTVLRHQWGGSAYVTSQYRSCQSPLVSEGKMEFLYSVDLRTRKIRLLGAWAAPEGFRELWAIWSFCFSEPWAHPVNRTAVSSL